MVVTEGDSFIKIGVPWKYQSIKIDVEHQAKEPCVKILFFI